MKVLHTADWHIGKNVNNMSMEEEQRYILDEIYKILVEESIDLLVIAGDIFDRSVPPASAVVLLDEFLTRVSQQGIKTCIISGNHDSPQRIEFASRILEKEGIFMEGTHQEKVRKIVLDDEYGPLNIYLLPFIRPSMFTSDNGSRTYDEIFHQRLELIDLNQEERNLLVAHQFVVGATTCESEELAVGGIDMVSSLGLEAFDYVALGHLHSPQMVQKDYIRYSGTPLPYSFSEEKNENSVTILHFKEKGHLDIRLRKLSLKRRFQTIKGKYQELVSPSYYQNLQKDNYFRVILEDEDYILEVMEKLRSIYPNIMAVSYDNQRSRQNQEIKIDDKIKEKTPIEIFEQFYYLQNNQNLDDHQKRYLQRLVETIWEEEN